MNLSEISSAASRLCAQCGLCCNGVLFRSVALQPTDSARKLAALGLKLKRRHRRDFILQPCPAFRNEQCAIYADRPERCRLFECGHLRRVAAGEITEVTALEKIREVQRRVNEINVLLAQAGKTNLKRPLSKRFEKAMAEQLAPSSDPATAALQRRLSQAMLELNTLLNDGFRIEPSGVMLSGSVLQQLGLVDERGARFEVMGQPAPKTP